MVACGCRGDDGELAAAHGGEQVRGVILAHADLDGWVGAVELAEGAAVRCAPLLRDEVAPRSGR
ncbi:MAG: hypothetical protein OJF49_003048 [Ktedonobacterales bacterium]|nr:MAG: hypothetical protein OJF49_003048 [Ktedonobacterales bacterium]